jgi:DNA gyrase subunit B
VFARPAPGGARRTSRAPEGLVATVRPRAPGSAVAHVQATVDQGACSACGGTVRVAAAFGWRADASRVDVEGWANLVRDDAGAHVDGLLRGVEAALSRARRRRSRRAMAGARLHGLAASVSVLVPNPTYLGSRRDRLRNPEVAGAVERVVEEQLGAWLELHPREVAAWR